LIYKIVIFRKTVIHTTGSLDSIRILPYVGVKSKLCLQDTKKS